jgi:hemerythrin
MKKIAWDSSLAVGVDTIDEQHKMLIERLNDLAKAIEMTQGEGNVLQTLDFLIEYTHFHFSAEEKCMAEYDYPGLDYQKKQHEEFKASLKNLVDDYEYEGVTRALTTSVNVFLLNWLVNHIKGVDRKLGEFLQEKGVTPGGH